jgi:hypothetical protein
MKKKIILTSIILLILGGIFVGIPRTISNKHPSPHPKSEAWKNLKILHHLEEEYYAQKGRYVPELDGKAYYKEGDTSIQNVLPYFRPGMPKELLFEYELAVSADGSKFVATATGKVGSRVAGEKYYVNQADEKNW